MKGLGNDRRGQKPIAPLHGFAFAGSHPELTKRGLGRNAARHNRPLAVEGVGLVYAVVDSGAFTLTGNVASGDEQIAGSPSPTARHSRQALRASRTSRSPMICGPSCPACKRPGPSIRTRDSRQPVESRPQLREITRLLDEGKMRPHVADAGRVHHQAGPEQSEQGRAAA